ncbi:hypothetical protein EXE10_09245 [Acinetobacter sp. WCHAc060033]|uniref:hypothetical protein n=1 Tax=Acinetobacter sp. WCHAc060033 TaxID=2518624 RepID=UPI001022F994|nr:hypothetical protein [Acinetobacter sp. WCHAc060033]RZG85709.1 hypothetical protein EXE10_09245 [Acinetobacter sp. WCHAc060033]
MKTQTKFIYKILFSSTLPFLFYSATVHAGAEDICEPDFYLNGDSYNKCSNLPVLVPSNDNQTNMLLLLSDLGLANIKPRQPDTELWTSAYGQTPFEGVPSAENRVANQRIKFANDQQGYDERCNTLANGKTSFITQVQNNKNISASEKQALIAERNKISECTNKIPLIPINAQWSPTTRQYASYLNATIAFYNANFSTATKIYSVLSTVDDAWLKETSQYMLIRSSLNSAYATGTNQYGDVDLDKINKTLLKQFLDNITAYLKAYPNGQYAASARGFMRRGFWLTGRQDLLVNEIVWQINNPKSKYYNLDVNEFPAEIDRRIFGSQYFNVKNLNDPFLLATYDLMQMRDSSAEGYKPITWTQLNAQKEIFKNQPELFKHLQAVHLFYVQKKPQEASKYLSDANDLNQYIQLSQAFLKGQILEKTNPTQAEQYWSQLLNKSKNTYQRGLFETALSNHLNTKQDVSAFIGKKPLIGQINLQKRFILYKANNKSLQNIIQNNVATTDQKQAAIYTLLHKSLNLQNYALFNQYYSQLPKDAVQYKDYESSDKYKEKPPFADFVWNGTTITQQLKCSNLPTLTSQLEKSPKDPLLNVCMGEYVRTGHHGFPYQMNGENTSNQEDKGEFARGDVYKSIIKSSTKGELHAYALYRAIMCYSPSGMNDCNDKEVPKTVRKQWYDQIKQDYPNTTWAKSLKYYW